MFVIGLAFVFMLAINVQSDQSGFISIDCGATNSYTDSNTGLNWVPDSGFTKLGFSKTFGNSNMKTWLTTLRYFPESSANKYCYVFPVLLRRTYLVRTSYYYGDYDGRNSPPVFDQIIDGTIWGLVNTSTNYSMGSYTFYEAVIESTGKTLSLCLGRNAKTVGDPFVSAIELRLLRPSMYNSTNFEKYGMTTVARSAFGSSGNDIIRYPADSYDRFWMPFHDSHQNISTTNISVTGIWNIPPPAVFETALITNKLESMEIQWPQQSLADSSYYIALYFNNIDNLTGPPQTRIFNISFNGIAFFSDLNVSENTAWSVFTPDWPLQGLTKLSLDPVSGSVTGPLINAGEVFQLFSLGGRTLTRDVTALSLLKKSLTNVPVDWEGDPCLPVGYSWTGITCLQGNRTRVTVLNLTSLGLSGSLSPSIAKLTALSHVWLGNNNLSGPIPDLSSLKLLSSMHLEGNKLNGTIPNSLANLTYLSELFLQNNDLSGKVPEGLLKKPGLELRISPGNPLLETQSVPATSPAQSSERSKAQGRKQSCSHLVWALGLLLGHLFFISVNLQNNWCS